MYIAGDSNKLDFLVKIDDKTIILPYTEVSLEAICDPTETGVNYQYQWKYCPSDTHAFRPFDMQQDGRFMKLSSLEEGEYEFEVKVGYKKNDSEYKKDLERTARGKAISISGS